MSVLGFVVSACMIENYILNHKEFHVKIYLGMCFVIIFKRCIYLGMCFLIIGSEDTGSLRIIIMNYQCNINIVVFVVTSGSSFYSYKNIQIDNREQFFFSC